MVPYWRKEDDEEKKSMTVDVEVQISDEEVKIYVIKSSCGNGSWKIEYPGRIARILHGSWFSVRKVTGFPAVENYVYQK